MNRRQLMGAAAAAGAALGLPACAQKSEAAYGDIPPLKSLAPYALGVCAGMLQLRDAGWVPLATRHFSRITPEWEMKMEYIIPPEGGYRFDRPDALVKFASDNGMAVHGHTLVFYPLDDTQNPNGGRFKPLADKPDAFLNAYTDYITVVVKRYAGRIPGWDVVNEAFLDDGTGLRDCLWRQALGDDYIGLAYEAAHQADPNAVLLINDYNLERTPAKRTALLKFCEKLLKNGAPLHGIGTQTHIDESVAPGMVTAAIRDITSLGLKVHVSEIDISMGEDKLASIAEKRAGQLRLINEIVKAYDEVPAAQRYGMSVWGARDTDSWIRREPGMALDEPLLFDGAGRPKPMAVAFAKALQDKPS